ncbi:MULTISPECIES: ATP-binding protein [unclassified Bacteroides]|jgi:two-component system sensor histidine kinase EvgS|uniref:hybrid sensor histidine kinase/response regulator n=1 Tax=unclassified Bacteroides TaxID=2646097 RepID=UPI000E9208DF|nr:MULTISPECIES: ATP-binding protein [unclassified Bacteroides]RGN65403.1 hybrid sensor histidine kinase/response regulator [Bacteroides sp. OM05-10AA]RGQ69631.1 hybrid sensor histidine kinase/response regulator [Bacteroides sp. AF27-33]
MKILLQHKIFIGYFLLMVIIGSMVAIILHERNRVQKIEVESISIFQTQHNINTAHRYVTALVTYGESVLVWDNEDTLAYRKRRVQTDSMLQALRVQCEEFILPIQIDSLRTLLAAKEAHLFQIMEASRKQRQTDSLLFNQKLIVITHTATKTVIRKKKGIAGLFGGKETVQLPITTRQTSLDKNLILQINRQQRVIENYTDSLRLCNKELNRKLRMLITNLDEQTWTAFRNKEVRLKASYERSTVIITGLITFSVALLVVFYLIIQRDIKKKVHARKERERLINELNLSVEQNNVLIASRKKAVHTITHELRTPLTAITGYAELLQKECNKENSVHFLQNIQQSSGRMRDMLNTLLDFFRLDNGKEQPKMQPCRISAITQTLETEFMPVAMNKGLSLIVKNESDAIILTDKERIIQIGNNLLSNAIKFTEVGGVSLTTDYTDGVLTLIVEDTGTGMTKDEQECVFGAFERLSNAAAKDGFGLGLSIVQRIVAMLGGTVLLESERGKGSRFTVEIPMLTAGEQPKQSYQGYARRNEAYHEVIAIDNDEVLLLMLKEMYAQEGVHCDTCTDAAELIELIRKKEYSLLLTDLNMPDINGFELLELLRTSNVGNSKTIPVVVTTASGSCSKEELMERGFSGCLLKPFSISELMEVSDKCAMQGNRNEKPDFTSLLSYGNEAVMLEKLITETEKEMLSVMDAEQRKDLQELDTLTHHLRSSWEILRADQPLKELHKLLHCEGTSNNEAIHNAVKAVLDKGSEIIRLAKEERRKYENG